MAMNSKEIDLFMHLFCELESKIEKLDSIVENANLKNKVWLTMGELENYLNCDKSTIRRYMDYNQLPHYKTGTIYFRREEVDNWLEQKRIVKLDANDKVASNKRIEEIMGKYS